MKMEQKEKVRIYNQRFWNKNKERLKLKNREWKTKNREKVNKTSKAYRIKRRTKVLTLIGKYCVLCGSTKKLCFHEIHGKKHPFKTTTDLTYVENHPKDFRTMCLTCHTDLHYLFKTNPIKVIELLKKLYREFKTNPSVQNTKSEKIDKMESRT